MNAVTYRLVKSNNETVLTGHIEDNEFGGTYGLFDARHRRSGYKNWSSLNITVLFESTDRAEVLAYAKSINFALCSKCKAGA